MRRCERSRREEARTQQELARELGLPYADIPPEQLPHWAVDAQRLALARRLREAQAPVVDARESPQADDDNAVEAGTRPSQESATKHDAATNVDRTVTSEVTAGSAGALLSRDASRTLYKATVEMSPRRRAKGV